MEYDYDSMKKDFLYYSHIPLVYSRLFHPTRYKKTPAVKKTSEKALPNVEISATSSVGCGRQAAGSRQRRGNNRPALTKENQRKMDFSSTNAALRSLKRRTMVSAELRSLAEKLEVPFAGKFGLERRTLSSVGRFRAPLSFVLAVEHRLSIPSQIPLELSCTPTKVSPARDSTNQRGESSRLANTELMV